MNGMLSCTILEGSFNAASFTTFIENLLNHMQPWPAPNSVMVMDNCTIYKSLEICELIESRPIYFLLLRHRTGTDIVLTCLCRGMKLEFLLAYSPDFNPIELAFSLIKCRVHCVGLNNERDEGLIVAALYGETMSISAANCRAFYRHCGYHQTIHVFFLHSLIYSFRIMSKFNSLRK